MTDALIEELAVKTWGETHRIISVSGETGCQPAGSQVLMEKREWKNIEDIKVGDYILSPKSDGTYVGAKVLKTTKWFCEENYDVFDVTTERKKYLYSCSYNHIIPHLENLEVANTDAQALKSGLRNGFINLFSFKFNNDVFQKFENGKDNYDEVCLSHLDENDIIIPIPIVIEKNKIPHFVYGFTLDSESGWYITDNFMITHNSGKSRATQMVARMIAENTGVPFVLQNICFTFEEILKRCKTLPKNSTLVADESVLQTGLGMMREKFDIMNIEYTSRKYGLNIMWVYPEANIKHATAHFELETIGICKEKQLTKLALKKGNYYFGYAVIDVTEAGDKMWQDYNEIKDKFIEDILQRKIKRMNYEEMAIALLSIPAFERIEKLAEMKAYARSCDDIIPSSITEQELNQIAYAVIKIKKDKEYQELSRSSQFDEAIDKSLREEYPFIGK
jgi:hypothetical protein